ncbi:MAG: CZB domain-containing protein, partial [Proteobacteria bacterium]|nr:CZB domain-containing protein [Pseudomonadota bacterium]
MNWKNWSIGIKIGVALGVVLLLMVGISGVGLLKVSQLSSHMDEALSVNALNTELANREIDHLRFLGKITTFFQDASMTTLDLQTDDHKCKFGKWLYGEGRKEAEQKYPELASQLKELEAPHALLHDSVTEMQQLLANAESKGVALPAMQDVFRQKTQSALVEVSAIFQKMGEELSKKTTVVNEQAEQGARSAIQIILILTALALVIGIVFGFNIVRIISGSLKKMVLFTEKLAEGDLTGQLEISQKDEIGILAKTLTATVDQWRQIIGGIGAEVTTLAASSQELTSTSRSLSAGAGNSAELSASVAAATEEMSANMNSVAAASEEAATNVNIVATAAEEISSTIHQIAAKTEQAKEITSGAVLLAQSSTEKVDALGRAALEISKVTEAITEISDQTNLLAL